VDGNSERSLLFNEFLRCAVDGASYPFARNWFILSCEEFVTVKRQRYSKKTWIRMVSGETLVDLEYAPAFEWLFYCALTRFQKFSAINFGTFYKEKIMKTSFFCPLLLACIEKNVVFGPVTEFSGNAVAA